MVTARERDERVVGNQHSLPEASTGKLLRSDVVINTAQTHTKKRCGVAFAD
jgi:hypothetical protein